jgi:hypothetical protein
MTITDILPVCGKAMINSSRQNDQVILLQSDADPVISCASHVEESFPIQYVSNLFVFVKMLVEEHLHLHFIDVSHLLRRDCNFISVLVTSFSGNRVYIIYRRASIVDDTEVTQVTTIDGFPRVMVVALVTLKKDSVLASKRTGAEVLTG